MFKITAAFCLVWATLSLIILASREGEGWDLTMQIPETAAILTTFDSFPSAVNQHGETPSFGCGHWQRSDQVRKRSLLRALRRAYVHGHTWYRGQQYTFATLQRAHPYLHYKPTQSNPLRNYNIHQKHIPTHRLRYMMWNGGGLSQHCLEEVTTWLRADGIQVALLSETRWRFENSWQSAHWHHIHSGAEQDRGAGLPFLICRNFCNPDAIRWHPIIPGGCSD